MPNLDNIEELLESLIRSSSKKVSTSLRIINKVCEEQKARGSLDFTIATIGKLSKINGGPSTQSIRNKTGEKYRALIQAWKKSAETKRKPKSLELSEPHDWTDRISEVELRWLAKDMMRDLKKLRGEISILKGNLSMSIDLRENQLEIDSNQIKSSPDLPEINITPLERKALIHSISPENIKSRGWKRDSRGQIVDQESRQIYKPGYAIAIEKIIELSSETK